MKDGDLRNLEQKGDHQLFADQERDDDEIHRVDLRRCVFRNVGFRSTKFIDGHLTHSLCIDGYFKGALFKNVDLTGTKFVRCNFRNAYFECCNLRYAMFHQCILDLDRIVASLPQEVNLRFPLLRSLRLNASEMGDAAAASRLLLMELEAERLKQFAVFTAASPYFAENFSHWDRVNALLGWVSHHAQSFLWGYGLRVLRLLRTATVVILASAMVTWAGGARFSILSATPRTLGLLESIYVSTVTFSTLGSADSVPASALARFMAMADSVSGAVFLGLLAAAAYRRIRP